MSLYTLTQDFLEIDAILEKAIEEDRQVETSEAEMLMQCIKEQIENKADNIAYYIKNVNSEIEAKAEEITRLKKRKKEEERKLENFKNYVINNLILLEKKNVNTSIGKLSIRTTKAVEVNIDINTLPDKFKRVKTTVEPNKTELKKALKGGVEIKGVELVENYNLNIR